MSRYCHIYQHCLLPFVGPCRDVCREPRLGETLFLIKEYIMAPLMCKDDLTNSQPTAKGGAFSVHATHIVTPAEAGDGTLTFPDHFILK